MEGADRQGIDLPGQYDHQGDRWILVVVGVGGGARPVIHHQHSIKAIAKDKVPVIRLHPAERSIWTAARWLS
jgi:hypothetical protein